MREFEQKVKRGARSYWQGIHPDPAFAERLIHLVESDAKHRAQPQRKRTWSRIALAGLAASIVVAVSLPGVRAAATNVIRKVFHVGMAEYVVQSGSDPVPAAEDPVVMYLNPKPDSDNRWFYTQRGPLPVDGIAAVQAMAEKGPVTGDHFRLPAWLPEDAPKRLQLPLEGDDNNDPRYTLAVISNGKSIMLAARSPMVGYMELVGTTKVDSQKVVLGGIEALEVQMGNEITYYLSLDNVTYKVWGPTTEKEVVKKIAESLTSQNL